MMAFIIKTLIFDIYALLTKKLKFLFCGNKIAREKSTRNDLYIAGQMYSSRFLTNTSANWKISST